MSAIGFSKASSMVTDSFLSLEAVAKENSLIDVSRHLGKGILFADHFTKQRARESIEFSELPRRISSKDEEKLKTIAGHVNDFYRMKSYYVFDDTWVKLKDKMNYNANYVFNRFGIAAEAPLKKTEAAFWQLIWETNTDCIVMLADFLQSSRYFKNGKYGNITVERVGKPEVILTNGQQALVKRTLHINDGKERKTITHWRIKEWPDKGVIPVSFLADIVKLFASEVKQGKINRILTHCMAGIGRTGTFLAALIIYLEFLAGRDSSGLVHKTVLNLRRERNGSVQTSEQYALIYSAFAMLQWEIYLQSHLKTKNAVTVKLNVKETGLIDIQIE
jgi:protein tyrosine phosphatase